MLNEIRLSKVVTGAVLTGALMLSLAAPASAATADIFSRSSFAKFGIEPSNSVSNSTFSSRATTAPGASTRAAPATGSVQSAALSSPTSRSASVGTMASRVSPSGIRSIITDLREAVRERDRTAVRESVRNLVEFVRRAVSPN